MTVLTTLRKPKRFERENFTSGRRRRPSLSSMRKVAIVLKHGTNSKTTRRTTSAIWSIFADLNSPLSPKLPDKDALSILT